MHTRQEIEHLLKKCGLPTDAKTLDLAERLEKLHHKIEFMDLSQLSQTDRKLLGESVQAWYKTRTPKDIDTVDGLLGKTIDPSQAASLFLEKEIVMSKVPRSQRDLIHVKKNTFLDPITLQQQTLDNVVQIRESGELMTRETFHEFVKNNTSTWRNKKNVGFFTPITNTMIGNPTLYNFDNVDFFPQKPGVLTVTFVPNKQKIPSSKKPYIVPSHYIKMEYQTLTFYLPYTPAGVKVFFLFKDAFKKGNLFAVDKTGYIRHGRVHKRTALGASSSHSFPDDTYLERVSGELASLGSTLYTYMHSQDKKFDLYADPYPDETRFKINIKRNSLKN